jgi:hypothetical protein
MGIASKEDNQGGVYMRLMHRLFAGLASACLVTTPAMAGQHVPHQPTPAAVPAPPPAPPAHSVAHPAPVPVPDKIAANPALVTHLQPLLPSGTTLASAATGFRNQGQFIAALHVSHNLNIPFVQLKAEMTGADHDSLGQAIHELQPAANSRVAVRTAEHQTELDLKVTKPAKTTADADDR